MRSDDHLIFISHSSKDIEISSAICAEIEKSNDNIKCWIAPRDIPCGTEYAESIMTALATADLVLVVFSSNTNSSKHVIREIDHADSLGIPILVFRIEDISPTGTLEYFFKPDQWMDASNGRVESHSANLCNTILQLLDKSASKKGVTKVTRRKSKEIHQIAIGVDVGTTKIAAGLVDFSGPNRVPHILAVKKLIHSEIGNGKGIIQKIEMAVSQLIELDPKRGSAAGWIGIGLPGQVDIRTGHLMFAPGLQLRNIGISSSLEHKLGRRVIVDNDVNCATLAELYFGHGKIFRDFICIFVGTGIGLGIVIDGQLMRGHSFCAGEIGHMKVDCFEAARKCTCGAKGCLEEYASARAIIRISREKIFDIQERKIESSMSKLDPQTVKPEDLAAAVQAGDSIAMSVAEQFIKYLAIGVSNVTNLLNPQAIILGGGIIKGFYGIEFISSKFNDYFKLHTLDAASHTQMIISSFDDGNPIIGASSLGLANSEKIITT